MLLQLRQAGWVISCQELLLMNTITVDPARLAELDRRINQHKWVAYDPDRAEMWQKMSAI